MRSIAALLLAIVVAVEIYFMMDFKPPRSLMIPSPHNITRQNIAMEQHMEKYMLIIGATVLVGGIVVFSLPARRRKE